jgi:hypothetical protein
MSSIKDEIMKIPPVTRCLSLSYTLISVGSWVGLLRVDTLLFNTSAWWRNPFQIWRLYSTFFWCRKYVSVLGESS